MLNGFLLQIIAGTAVTLKLAVCAACFGLLVGLVGATLESIPYAWLRYSAASVIFIVRGLPELLVLFFIYFGATSLLSGVFHQYIDISAFLAGVLALGLIFGSYASHAANVYQNRLL